MFWGIAVDGAYGQALSFHLSVVSQSRGSGDVLPSVDWSFDYSMLRSHMVLCVKSVGEM